MSNFDETADIEKVRAQLRSELAACRESEAFWAEQPVIMMAAGPIKPYNYTERRRAEIQQDIRQTEDALAILDRKPDAQRP